MSNFFSALDDSGDEADNPKVVNRGLANNREEHTKTHPKKSSDTSKKSNANKQGGGGKQGGGNTKGGRGPRPTRDGKRTFDRKSGTGRGKEVKKGGGGAHNWGNDKNLARRNEGTVIEGQVEAGEEAAEAQELAEEPHVQEEEEVEEDKTLSYEEYMAQKSRPSNANFAPPKEREVVNEFANVKAAVAVEEDFLVMGGTKGQKKKGVRVAEERKTIEVGFRVADSNANQQDRRSNNRRDGDRRGSGGRGRGGSDRRGGGGRGRGGGGGRGRGGSGRGRGGGGGGGGGGKDSGLNVGDSSAFPSL